MKKKLYLIHTINQFMDMIYTPFAKPFLEENEDFEIYNIADDSLLPQTLEAGELTESVAKRIMHYALAAESNGADGTGQAYVWDADHDGYTILGTSETPLLVPVMTGMKQTTKDFEYFIGGGSPGLLLVNKDAGIATIEELIAGATADPDKYKVASTAGGLWFILANLFSSYGDVPLGNVTYDGSRPAITACVSGETAAVTASAGEVADFIKSGDLIPLVAIQPDDYDFPGYGVIPAVTKTIPALEKYLPLNQFIGFMVPADTDPAKVAVLQEAFGKAMETEAIAKFAEDQFAVIYNMTGEEARAFCAKAQSTMSWILQDMGLTEFSPEDFGIPKP